MFDTSQPSLASHRGRVWSGCNDQVVATAETWCDQSDLHSLQTVSVVMEYNYITMCLADVSMLLSNHLCLIITFLHENLMVAASQRKVWLARLVTTMESSMSYPLLRFGSLLEWNSVVIKCMRKQCVPSALSPLPSVPGNEHLAKYFCLCMAHHIFKSYPLLLWCWAYWKIVSPTVWKAVGRACRCTSAHQPESTDLCLRSWI